MTFKDLYDDFRLHNDRIMKSTTIYGYTNKEKYIKCFYKIKAKDFNIIQYNEWKNMIDASPIATRTKNNIYKFLKSILNYGVKWHGFNYQEVYNKMINFNNPKERKKKMNFYTYNEFKKFISEEEDLKYRVIFEILYYCGLRKGELKGLTWKDIYFDKRILSVNKQITQLNSRKGFEFLILKSEKVIGLFQLLNHYLKIYKNYMSKIKILIIILMMTFLLLQIIDHLLIQLYILEELN